MPKYRSFDVGLHSQFDIEAIPEYYPEPKKRYIEQGITGFVPELVDDRDSTCSVYIPVLPGSIFWIGYSVSPPVPEGHYFLFKLYINGAHIVSWATGKEEGWKGKTMFGLFEGPEDKDGKRRVEKRALRFAPPNQKDGKQQEVVGIFDESACLEIKIHRANGRERVERPAEQYTVKPGKAIELINAGRAGTEHPKRFYRFALIDPIDQPFATFRFYHRTCDQLRKLGLLESDSNGVGEECDLSVIEPAEQCEGGAGRAVEMTASNRSSTVSEDGCQNDGTCITPKENRSGFYEGNEKHETDKNQVGCAAFNVSGVAGVRRPSAPGLSLRGVSDTLEETRAYVPRGAPRSKKTETSSSTSYRPHPADPVEDWTMHTPSPVKLVRDSIGTPPLERRRGQGRSTSSLKSMITSTWRRRGTGLSDAADNV